jgi:hypothetical protein
MRILLIVLGYVRELLERLFAHPIWTNSEVENVWLGRCAMGFVMTASKDLALLEEAVTGKTASADVSICDHWSKTLLRIFRSTNCPRRKYASGLDSRIFPEGNPFHTTLPKDNLSLNIILFLPRQFTKYTRNVKAGA